MRSTKRSRGCYDDYPITLPSFTVIETDPDDKADEDWTGLLDASGERILYRRPPMGFIDFDLLRATGQLPNEDG